MSNLAGLPARGQKEPKARPDRAYLARVRAERCCICEAFGEVQLSPTAAHHPIMGRFSQRKPPDRMAIPICEGHHQGNFDTSKVALHREPAEWERLYGRDFDYVAITQDKIGV